MNWRSWLVYGATAGLLTGCGTPRTIYYWGHYEPLIYTMYATPGKATPEVQLLKLEEDFQKAKAKNQPVPPGFHAHLGYLYFQLGKTDQARQEFETEKANFAEATVFMDRLLANLNKR
jgi:hypothetical protein